jgi:ABC-type transporter Mla subunit MlaD
MARKHRNEVLAGGFVVLALGLLVLLFFLKGTLGEVLEQSGEIQVVFDDVRGLKNADPVLFLGSKVGRVTGVEIVPGLEAEKARLFPPEAGPVSRVIVTLRLPRRIQEQVRSDSPVEISKSLTGNVSVLIGRGQGQPLPAERAVLKGRSGVELAELAGRLDALFLKAGPVVEQFACLARQFQEGLLPVQKDLAGGLAEARAILAENRSDLRSLTANLAEGVALARKVLEKVEPAAGELKAALSRLEEAAGTLNGVVAENRSGLSAIVEDARTAIANAANITADVRRRPWRLLYRPSKSEEGSLDLYDAAWAYNLGAADLERSLDFLAAQLRRDPGAENGSLRNAYLQVEASLRRHREAEEAFWARLKR